LCVPLEAFELRSFGASACACARLLPTPHVITILVSGGSTQHRAAGMHPCTCAVRSTSLCMALFSVPCGRLRSASGLFSAGQLSLVPLSPFHAAPQASLSVTVLFASYIAQQRFRPFVAAESLSSGLQVGRPGTVFDVFGMGLGRCEPGERGGGGVGRQLFWWARPTTLPRHDPLSLSHFRFFCV
jgi:hypothetical protein